MAKRTPPIITQAEIISRAIISIESEIEEWNNKCATLPQAQRDTMFEAATVELRAKLDTLKILYQIETGTDFAYWSDAL